MRCLIVGVDGSFGGTLSRSLQSRGHEVVATVGDWLRGGPAAAGFMTSGGTESILMAVKAARERGHAERDPDQPHRPQLYRTSRDGSAVMAAKSAGQADKGDRSAPCSGAPG